MTVTVREARQADVPALATMISELGYPVSEAELEARLSALAGQGQPALVAEDGDVIGCLTWNVMAVLHRDTSVGRISLLVVDPAKRSSGVGSKLVAEAEARIRALGCRLIEVTSNEKRVEAHRFYQRLGYVRTSFRFARVLEEGREKE